MSVKPYLVFRLYGAMASWGQPAVGMDRYTEQSPSRSGILGLIGAALGIKRENEVALQQLQQTICMGMKTLSSGVLLRDYHTIQVPQSNKKIELRTRKQEIEREKEALQTILSKRDYRCDALWVVALFLQQKADYSLEQIQQALKTPVYPLYLGRKSCPLALPLMPKIVQAECLKEALDTQFPPITVSEKLDQYYFGHNQVETYFWDGKVEDLGVSLAEVLSFQSWDEPLNRQRWQFTQRWQQQVSISVGRNNQ